MGTRRRRGKPPLNMTVSQVLAGQASMVPALAQPPTWPEAHGIPGPSADWLEKGRPSPSTTRGSDKLLVGVNGQN